MIVGIDVAASDADQTIYAAADERGVTPLCLPKGGTWTFMEWRDCVIAANHLHRPMIIRRVEDERRYIMEVIYD